MALLEIEALVKLYPGGIRALDRVSLSVEKGEFLVVIGLSGSGKSTLLRCINRLIEPSSGRISFDGADVLRAGSAELRRLRSQIGMIFQHFNLVKRRSVMENVLNGALGSERGALATLGLFSRERRDEALAALARVGIEHLAWQRGDELSGGQMQRVAIARALMQRPKLLLADEPVAALDPATSDSVMAHLERLNKEDGLTVVASLHFLSLARRYATRVVALRDGRIAFDGPPGEIDAARFASIYGEEAVEVEIR